MKKMFHRCVEKIAPSQVAKYGSAGILPASSPPDNRGMTFRPARLDRGVALLIVLAVLVLLTVLVVGFFGRATVERAAASADFEGNRNRNLADRAAAIVQAQVDAASTQKNKAWASQPGMVRTFKPNGTLEQAFKLYSASDMVSSTVSLANATAELSDWATKPALFVDLNEPVTSNGTKIYPILNPNATAEGFEIKSTGNITSASQPAPMPVQWLYVLQDGQTVAPTGSGSNVTIAGATSSNPIIGRIAFWADDATSKLNINTASHGFFWDLPRASTFEERNRMARFQPAAREYQRYPGHPATTSLWPVFHHKFPNETAFANWVYDLAPRIAQGGSQGGTVYAGGNVTLDTDRLYSSVDELLFKATGRTERTDLTRDDIEQAKFFLTARSNSPEINRFNLPRMAIWPVNAGNATENVNGRYPSTLDSLLAFCSTINNVPYYFQRAYPNSSTQDMSLGRNIQLRSYINTLLGKPFPGFDNGTFTNASKYGADVPQITTEIFDYIRSSNLYSTALGATAYTDGNATQAGSRSGQVVPLQTGATKGFGRMPMISKAILQFYVSGIKDQDGNEFSDQKWGTGPAVPEAIPSGMPGGGTQAEPAFQNFLQIQPIAGNGTAKTFHLITRGIIYFDMFDPMYGYTFPRYNFDIDIATSGAWSVTANGTKALDIPSNTALAGSKDPFQLYRTAFSHTVAQFWFGQVLGGLMAPNWLLACHDSLSGNPSPGKLNKAYPLVSVPLDIHIPVTVNSINGTYSMPAASSFGGNFTFDGGSLTATIKVGNETVQTYQFDFPAFNKPLPLYADSTTSNPTYNNFSVIKHFISNVDFRYRWGAYLTAMMVFSAANPAWPQDTRLIQETDVAVALEPTHGDKRLLAAKASVAATDFQMHQFYGDPTRRIAADIRAEPFGRDRKYTAAKSGITLGRIVPVNYGENAQPDIPSRFAGGLQASGVTSFPPDFDNGIFSQPDDATVSRADEGSARDNTFVQTTSSDREFAWYMETVQGFNEANNYLNNPTFFSPNKQMASPVVFGSLPTGVLRDKPWQTLLFRPDPGNHPGADVLPDHLLLDLFWMPVVEPYAISERFSTNGKVNMNYQIMPFGGYLTRATGLVGVMQTLDMISIPDTQAHGSGPYKSADGTVAFPDYHQPTGYKSHSDGNPAKFSSETFRKSLRLVMANGTVDPQGILKTFEDKFAGNDLFISETQICEVPLIPSDGTWSSTFETSYWGSRQITGDNSREAPYAQLLPRLTTRSNTYDVHYRVQSLKKAPGTAANVWDENKDKVTAELRGSRTIERYIDPNNASIPDYLDNSDPTNKTTLERFYRWRSFNNREFAP